MYIKQIIIQGFKSYKEQTVMEPFSPGTNVVVGRNGSGKSNFFAAIRFVLSDAYTQMSREERQALLHEGSGSAVMSAYVEIIFDNSDRRFQTNNDEVVIRRTIGLKKDEYSLDRKVVTKQEVMSLLEGAGFSKANPYYIVPQGRVTALTNMKETERLNLLKEIAGTNTYETRRAASLKIMTETQNKFAKIDELLEYIKERLAELEEEKEELRGFQEKDKERRCLEYAYYHRQQEKVAAQLSEIEETRQNNGASSREREEFNRGEQDIQAMEQRLRELDQELELLAITRRQLDEDRKGAAKNLAKVEMKVKELDATKDARNREQQNQQEELLRIQAEIKAKSKELAKITPQFEKREAEEADVKRQMDLAEGSYQRLVTKQSRVSQFKNKRERDDFLQKEINETNMSITTQKAAVMDAEEGVKMVENSIARLEGEIKQIRDRKATYGADQNQVWESLRKAHEDLERLEDQRKQIRRDKERLEAVKKTTGESLSKAEGELKGYMDMPTYKGLMAMRSFTERNKVPGAYGFLAELMTVPQDAYQTAVEAVGGGSLFHFVVDNEQTGTQLGDYLRDNGRGRLTFMPLNKLHNKRTNLPRAPDAEPLINKIEFDDMYEQAFEHVFGRTMVCQDLRIAGQLSLNHSIECVTLDGDKTHKAGAVTGGYLDTRKSRLKAVHKVKTLHDQYEEQLKQLNDFEDQLNVLNQECTRARGEEQKWEQRNMQSQSDFGSLNDQLRRKEEELDRQMQYLEKVKMSLATIELNLQRYDQALAAAQNEMASDFKKALSASEEQQLETFSEQVREFRQQWNDISRERRQLGARKQQLEQELRLNLRPQEDELSTQVIENQAGGGAGSDKDAQKELKKAQKALAEFRAQLRQNEDRNNEIANEKKEVEAQKAEKEQTQHELARHIEKLQQRIEKNVQRKALLTAQAAEFAKNIRDLGVLPEEAFQKYERMKPEQIESRIKKVNEALKKYKHVNKKAFEQFNSFTTQEEQLLKRREELDESKQAIDTLIDHLDQAKDEAIERTFKQVSKEFSTIFERLVPAGHGRLVIQRKTDRGKNRNAEGSDDEGRGGSIDSYTGVGISVSFNSKTFDEQQKIQQLSGGQKSLCALCLIFAIQATETSPMVIFDEVDANLDAQYRTAVASLLESTSKEAGTQFICTTFRPEIVLVADKCYGVTFHNKTSTIDCVPTEDALNFVEGQQKR